LIFAEEGIKIHDTRTPGDLQREVFEEKEGFSRGLGIV
jgi:hypothetical protein